VTEDVRATASRIGAALFLPVRTLAGPLHRRRPALRDEQRRDLQDLPPLPPEWSYPRWYRGDFAAAKWFRPSFNSSMPIVGTPPTNR